VTENLHDTLFELRRRKLDGYLWIDVICIDQSNTTERSEQVLLMDSIYTLARQVIIWLGKEQSDLVHYHDMLKRYKAIFERGEMQQRYDFSFSPSDPGFLQAWGFSAGEYQQQYHSLSLFFYRCRWFSRIWVVQEFALAQELYIICGSTTLDHDEEFIPFRLAILMSMALPRWPSIVQLEGVWNRLDSRTRSKQKQQRLQSYYAMFRAETAIQYWYAYMITLLEELRGFEASDACDKVYAVYGIANKLSSPYKPPFLTANSVNYKASCEYVYKTFAQDALTHLPTLAMLSFAVGVGPQKPALLPSWCPDYRRSVPIWHTSSLPLQEHERATQTVPCSYSASGTWNRLPPFNSISDGVLSVMGRAIGTIKKISAQLITSPNHGPSIRLDPNAFI